MKELAIVAAFAPLLGALVAGLGGRAVGRTGSHTVTIFSVLLSFLASCWIFVQVLNGAALQGAEGTVYTWMTSGGTRFEIGFLVDRLTALMMVVVTFVSLMVHIYTIG
jgi:NADH-quinone oxidoreductase subunit L